MIRNGITIPFPSELATPPASSSQTGRGSCGLSPRRYAATAFSAARGYPRKRQLPSALIDSSSNLSARDNSRRGSTGDLRKLLPLSPAGWTGGPGTVSFEFPSVEVPVSLALRCGHERLSELWPRERSRGEVLQ